jgi:hypothetical protein
MPCTPTGISVKSGRTSALYLFLSMPRYSGASRNRISLGSNVTLADI